MDSASHNLDQLREQIDEIDKKVVDLLNQRAAVVVQIGQTKHQAGTQTYVPQRERAVLDKIKALNTGPLSNETLIAVYRELMSGSFSLARPPRIAYLGPAGSFSHLAAVRKFGASVDYQALSHIRAIFDEIDRDRADLGIVPIENTRGGGIADTLDAFVDSTAVVCAELNLAVHLHLLGVGPSDRVQKIYSKPEAFSQCQKWLAETGLLARTVAVASTSEAARLASEQPDCAAIGSALARDLFGLNVLADRIEDDSNNVTRFLVLAKESAQPTGDDKTALYFNASDRPGALVEVLGTFEKHRINMTFIQSRPSRTKSFDYAFFVDLVGHAEDKTVSAAINDVRQHCHELKILGSFPRATETL